MSESRQIGARLRWKRPYSSHLTAWRRQRDTDALEALRPQKPGRKARRQDPLRQENDRLLRKLKQAEAIIEFSASGAPAPYFVPRTAAPIIAG